MGKYIEKLMSKTNIKTGDFIFLRDQKFEVVSVSSDIIRMKDDNGESNFLLKKACIIYKEMLEYQFVADFFERSAF